MIVDGVIRRCNFHNSICRILGRERGKEGAQGTRCGSSPARKSPRAVAAAEAVAALRSAALPAIFRRGMTLALDQPISRSPS